MYSWELTEEYVKGLEQLAITLENGVYNVPVNEARLVVESVKGSVTVILNNSMFVIVAVADLTDLIAILIEYIKTLVLPLDVN